MLCMNEESEGRVLRGLGGAPGQGRCAYCSEKNQTSRRSRRARRVYQLVHLFLASSICHDRVHHHVKMQLGERTMEMDSRVPAVAL
jgi:hypothetical protein